MRSVGALLLLALCNRTWGATVHRTLVLSEGFVSPDGCDKRAILVNGKFIGPTIRVKQGDELRVNVVNMLPGRGAAIHWHGIIPIDPWMEGAGGASQCLNQRGMFQYRFTVNASPGTYWYHGHAVSERVDGLYGALIVDPATPPPSSWATEAEAMIARTAGEFVVLLQDWGHANSQDQDAGLDANPIRFDPELARVVLVNGKANPGPEYVASEPTCVNATALSPAAPAPTFKAFTVEQGKSYYFRVVHAGVFHYLAMQFQGHRMTIVAADGQYIKPYETATLHINAGQRYGVIVHANRDVDNYWMPVNLRYSFAPPAGAAILHYAGAGAPQTWAASAGPPPVIPPDLSYSPRKFRGAETLPADMAALEPDEEIWMDGFFDLTGKWTLNGTVFDFPPSGTPLLNYAYSGNLGELAGTPSAPVATFPVGKVVDVIFEGRPLPFGLIEQHAWHMHGYHFYVLGHGPGRFDRKKHASLLNLKDPVRRDVVTLYPEGTRFDGNTSFIDPTDPTPYYEQSHGWVVVRFKTEHAGAWLMHCHISSHQYLRMAAYFVVQPDAIPAPRADMPECGTIEQYQTKGGAQTCEDGKPAVKKWGKCGGEGHEGATCCVHGSTCTRVNNFFSRCV